MPAEHDLASGDARRLGVAVTTALLGGVTLPPDALSGGWHSDPSCPWRWSDGDATLRLPRTVRAATLELRLDPPGSYRVAPVSRRAASKARRMAEIY